MYGSALFSIDVFCKFELQGVSRMTDRVTCLMPHGPAAGGRCCGVCAVVWLPQATGVMTQTDRSH